MEQIKLFFTLSFFSIITAGYYNYDSNPPIIVATVCGDLSEVKSYCTASTINTKGNNGQTALMHSCISKSGAIFVFLMENNADFNIKDSFGKTALDYAIEHNRVEMIEFLALSSGLDVDQVLKDANKKNKITREFIRETFKLNPDLDKIKSYIAAGANLNAVYYDEKGFYSYTALMASTKNDHTEIVKLLLSAGADVNARGNYGHTALMVAADHTEIAKLLISAGVNLNAGNNDGYTALMLAARNGHTESAKLLIVAGADVNANSKFGWTALICSAESSCTEIANLLIAAGADVNAKDNYFGWTALMNAARNNQTEIAKLLIVGGVNVNAGDKFGWTALMNAARNNNTEVAKLLIDSGAKGSISLIFKINHPNLYKTAVIGSATILGLGINYLIKKSLKSFY